MRVIDPNKYPGKCAACGSNVSAGAGVAFAADRGWQTCCKSAACARKLGLPVSNAPAGPPRREITESGLVYMPFDREALPLLRSMPGARWQPAENAWRVSTDPQSLPRVVELADRLGLAVPAAWRQALAYVAPEVEAAAGRADTAGLRPYQRDGVKWLSGRKHALLADEQGVGKTAQVLCSLPENGCSVVIVPAVVKYNWRNEAARWRPDIQVTVLEGRGSFRAPGRNEMVICNYDILPQVEDVPKGTRPPPLPFDLADCTLVVDEAQNIKGYKAKRTKSVTQLARQCARAWLLTGTPLLNRPSELWTLLSAGQMARDVFGSWEGFLRAFDVRYNRFGDMVWGDPDPSVPERLRNVMLRRTREVVLPYLPKKQYTETVVDLQSKSLKKALDNAWEEWGDEDEERLNLPDFTQFSEIRAALARDRIPALVEMVENLEDQGVPLLVFSAHREPVDTIGKREGWGVIHGDLPAEKKTRVVQDFQDGKLKGVALTIKSGGTGITLTRASTAIFCDRMWTPAENWQAEDRMVRIGQRADSVQIIQLVSDHVLDRHVANILNNKSRLIDATVDREIQYTPKTPAAGKTSQWVEESDEERDARIAAAIAEAEQREVKKRIEDATAKEQARAEKDAAEEAQGGRGKRGRSATSGRARMKAWEQPLTPEVVESIQGAIGLLAGACDYAKKQDQQGFNKADACRGHWLADAVHEGSEEALRLAWAMALRYPAQVRGSYPILWERVEDPAAPKRGRAKKNPDDEDYAAGGRY